ARGSDVHRLYRRNRVFVAIRERSAGDADSDRRRDRPALPRADGMPRRERCLDIMDAHLRHDVAYERIDTAGRHEFVAAEGAEKEVRIDVHGEIEAGIAVAKVFEHRGVGVARLEVRAEVRAGHHRDSSHSRAYSGNRLLSWACISLR